MDKCSNCGVPYISSAPVVEDPNIPTGYLTKVHIITPGYYDHEFAENINKFIDKLEDPIVTFTSDEKGKQRCNIVWKVSRREIYLTEKKRLEELRKKQQEEYDERARQQKALREAKERADREAKEAALKAEAEAKAAALKAEGEAEAQRKIDMIGVIDLRKHKKIIGFPESGTVMPKSRLPIYNY